MIEFIIVASATVSYSLCLLIPRTFRDRAAFTFACTGGVVLMILCGILFLQEHTILLLPAGVYPSEIAFSIVGIIGFSSGGMFYLAVEHSKTPDE